MPGTTYSTGGGGYTRTSIPGWGGGAGGGGGAAGYDMSGFSSLLDPELLRSALLQGLDQRNQAFGEYMAGKQQTRRLQAEEGKRTKETYKTEKKRRSREVADAIPRGRAAADRATKRDVAQTEALTGRQPMRRVFVMGAGGFDTTDPNKLTGAQRQVFLPNSNQQQGGPGRMELGGLSADLAFDSLVAQARERQRQSYGTGRG